MQTKEERAAYMRAWYARNAERVREHVKAYRLANIDKVREYDRARGHREKDKQKTRARNATRVLRKEPHACEKCNAPHAHAHHDDYSKPLQVRWLCTTCHGIEHRRY